jgi:CBS domain-containing protein
MSIGEVCNREVVVIGPDASIGEAVKLMRETHVGDIVVVERRGSERLPLGILTDRDIVIEVLAEEVDAATLTVGDVMSAPLVTARVDEEVDALIGRMRSHGVRRVPIVNADGGLEGIMTVDDILELLTEQMDGLVSLVRIEQQRELKKRSQP